MASETDQIIDQTLSFLKKKALDGYEVYLEESSHFEVESKEGKVESLLASRSWGMSIRILNRNRMGFSYITSSKIIPSFRRHFPIDLEQVVEEAMASTESISPDPCYDFSPDLKTPPPSLSIYDEQLVRISEKVKIEKVRLLEETARAVDPRKIQKVRKASYQDSVSQRTLINSNGLWFSYPFTLVSGSVTAVAEESGESEMGWGFDLTHFFSDLDVEKVGKEAGQRAIERLGGRRVPSGVYPVLLRNHVASEFLSLLSHSFLAEQVQKGKSPLKGKLGERYFSPLISIVDDGVHPKGASTSPIDGEGTPTQRTLLVNRGELLGYLYDRYWANRENLKPPATSTGNSRRSGIHSPPRLGISNLYIEPGEDSIDRLLKELHKGFVIEEVMGLHTVDPISGEFSLGCVGDWVEKGEKLYPVKSIAIAGNLFKLFQDIVNVGNDIRFIGSVGGPSLFIERLVVSGD